MTDRSLNSWISDNCSNNLGTIKLDDSYTQTINTVMTSAEDYTQSINSIKSMMTPSDYFTTASSSLTISNGNCQSTRTTFAGDEVYPVYMEGKDDILFTIDPKLAHIRVYPAAFQVDRYINDIEDIKVNNNVVIVFFNDGTKEIARPQGDDKFDLETGLEVCLLKHILGSSNYHKLGKKALKRYEAIKAVDAEIAEKEQKEKERRRKKEEKKARYTQRRLEKRAAAFAKAFKEVEK